MLGDTPIVTGRVLPHARPPVRSLDASFYALKPEEVAFFKVETGITDDNVLKQHILNVQYKAYEARFLCS